MKTALGVLALLVVWVVVSTACALVNAAAPGPFTPLYWWALSFTVVGGFILVGVVWWEHLRGKK